MRSGLLVSGASSPGGLQSAASPASAFVGADAAGGEADATRKTLAITVATMAADAARFSCAAVRDGTADALLAVVSPAASPPKRFAKSAGAELIALLCSAQAPAGGGE